MRLQKFLAKAGIASRRKAEELILSGKVKVNNELVTKLGSKVNPETDVVLYREKLVKLEEKKVYYMLNKPEGYVTTVKDERGRKTVLDLLSHVGQRIYPIGRLDYDTTGLLLLTNDGGVTYVVTHPKHEIEKTYVATVRGIPGNEELQQFRNGLLIEGKKTAKAKINIINKENNHATVSIKIIEGRNRQVRKMCALIGHPVIALKRISIGAISLGNLPLGQSRPLTTKETTYLKSL